MTVAFGARKVSPTNVDDEKESEVYACMMLESFNVAEDELKTLATPTNEEIKRSLI